MELITITDQAFLQLKKSLEEINNYIRNDKKNHSLEDSCLDIQDVCQILKISKRTLQSYRDSKILGYSQISGKIYFKASDVQTLLDKHYVKNRDCK
jgi:5-bromo-4-chloroindolyl phosphate hydrolysis protein